MKNSLLIITFFIFSSLAFGQINQTDAQGRKQGQWVKKYPNSSVIQYEGTFKNNIPVGTFTYKYQSNKVKAIVNHNEKTKRSDATFYHENGKVLSYGIYYNQKKDSIWTTFNQEGRVTMKETYKNDLLNGLKTLYYIPDDPEMRGEIIISEYNYKNGNPDGKFVEYYPNRQIRKTGQFKNNQRDGRWYTYEVDGKKIIDENYYDGKQHGWMIGYDKKGNEGERKYFYYGDLVEGKRLTKLLSDLKAKNISPYGGKIVTK